MLTLLLDSSIRITLVSAVTATALWAFRIRNASVRHAIWTSVVATMLLMPLLAAWAPGFKLALLPERDGPIRAPLVLEMQSVLAPGAETPAPVTVLTPASFEFSWQVLAIGAYSLGVVFFLLRLAAGTWQVRRLLSVSTLDRGQRVHPACATPVTVGWLRPVMILPISWTEWPAQQLRAVVAHEEEHVRRRDPLVQWVALLNRAIFWFHPLAWWLERELAKLAEQACDEAVLAKGVDSADYSNALLFLARSTQEMGSRIRLGTAMPGPALPSRLRAILAGARPQRISRWRLASITFMIGIAAVTFSTGKLVVAQPTLAFEVAAIKLHKDSGPRQVGVQIQGTSVIVHAMTLRHLVTYAYDVRDFQAEGGEKWTYGDGDRYDITARAPGETAPIDKEVRAMILTLLKERFKLQEHRSLKEMPVYALTVSPKGHRLKFPEKPDDPPMMMGRSAGREATSMFRNAPTAMIARSFGFQMDRPIIDQTGLTGKYDLDLKLTFAPDGTITGPSGESLFTAIEEQLGLKLEPKKAQVEVIVIDQAERPTEN